MSTDTKSVERLVENHDGICPRCLNDESYGCSCTGYEMQRFYADVSSDLAREVLSLRAERDAATARVAELEARLADAVKILQKSKGSLQPFSDCVFNDNGDLTVTPLLRTQGYTELVDAYTAHKAIRDFLAKKENRDG